MAAYHAPLRDMLFVLRELAGLDAISRLPGYEEVADVAEPILSEAAAFAGEVLAPLNESGDREGCTWSDGAVKTPAGFKEAYRKFAQAGWIGLAVPEAFGGQNLPQVLLGPTIEMWSAANVGFANGPQLNQSALAAIELTATDEQKQLYLPPLASGRWMGTMNLTEPQAGSDLGAVATKAVPEGDHYRIRGQKIFITFGEHDLAENIVHLVLARLPEAPEGTKGISLFIVPKFLPQADGSIGERNDVHCLAIEHKLGLNGNPTCTMNFGERTAGAIGYLVGEPNRGMEYMFVMMNAARFHVGVQAIGIADRAYQHAVTYARERVQGRDLQNYATRGARPVAIAHHPDVRRMLLWMRAHLEAARALAYVTAASLDEAAHNPDEQTRQRHQSFVELMTPIVKGWSSEMAVDVCSTALQVFGGVGYIEETGIAQQYRDVRITAIYEGTTGVQALDLVNRKLLRNRGETVLRVLQEMDATVSGLEAHPELGEMKAPLKDAIASLRAASEFLLSNGSDLEIAAAASVPYLKLWGIVAGGWQMARAAMASLEKLAENDPSPSFYKAKLATADFYATHVLSQSAWLERAIVQGSAQSLKLGIADFDLERKVAAPV